MAVNVSPVVADGFDYADANRDGFITYQEAAVTRTGSAILALLTATTTGFDPRRSRWLAH